MIMCGQICMCIDTMFIMLILYMLLIEKHRKGLLEYFSALFLGHLLFYYILLFFFFNSLTGWDFESESSKS